MHKNLKNTLLTFICLIGLMLMVDAQTKNPFEIVGRTKATAPINVPTEVDSTDLVEDTEEEVGMISTMEIMKNDDGNEIVTTSNPFEIIRNSNVNVSPIKTPVQKKKTILKKENKESGTSTYNLLFWLLTSVLIGLAFFITIYRNYLTKVYRSFTNHNILRLSHREQRSSVDFPYLFLYGLFFINMSIFVFLSSIRFFPEYVSAKPSTLLQIGSVVVGAYLIKHFVLNFLDYVFQIKPEMGLYNFTIMVFNNLLGIILVPLNFSIAFASPGLAKSLIFIGLAAIIGVYLFRALRSLLMSMKLFSFNKFQFFIYLCAVEIAPVLVLIKYIMIQSGIQ